MSEPASPWLTIRRGAAPLILSLPHTGTQIPPEIERTLVSGWLARKDADYWVDQLYAAAETLDATIVRTAMSRTVIDVNRDPDGASLYPGQATTGLCPTTTFDGEALYQPGQEPDAAEIERRRKLYFEPYHRALTEQIARLRGRYDRVVIYDAHSIRSVIPQLFSGELPIFNIGANSGASCDPALVAAMEAVCDASIFPRVTDGRFKGGYITRHYGRPDQGAHAVQMELACRAYMEEPSRVAPDNWPTPYLATRATPLRAVLTEVLCACLSFIQHS